MKSQRVLLRELMGHAASAGSLDTVYQAALDCVRVGLGIERASLLLFDATGKMRFVAWSGLSEEYRVAVDGHSPWSQTETDAAPLLTTDVENDATVAIYRPIMRREGIRALAFIPLQAGAKLLGKFMLYYRTPHIFTATEIATAEQIADYVAFALEHHRVSVALEEQLINERDLRHRAEAEALQRRESESRLHIALAAGQMATWDYDLKTRRILWSSELERMHGLEPGTFDGTIEGFMQFVHPLDANRIASAIAATTHSPKTDYQIEYRMLRADGTFRWLAGVGRLLFDNDGAPNSIVGVTADVTDAKRLAQAASEADRRKDDFLATLAHELRNPLAAIRTGVAVIRKSNGDRETAIEYCTVVERQLRHLTRLVDDLLDVADVTQRGMLLDKARIELSTVVCMAIEQNRTLMEELEHDFSLMMPVEPIVLDADPERLVQVLTNLLSNAVKYTPRGGRIQLTVTHDGDEVRLSVKDSGLGIPPDKLDSVFEMFGQLDRSLETGHKGLGIGLALSRAIVSMHGGRIKAQSDGLGAGSEFTVWFPLAIATDSPLPTEAAERSSTPYGTSGCRVLVVDDNQDVVHSMSRLLYTFGHEVRVALDGAVAMEIAEHFQPDVVLLDIAMPKVNGYEVARMLRSKPWGRKMTLVAVTGWGQDDDQRRSTEAGFDRHMTKPVDPRALEAFLESVARKQATAKREPILRERQVPASVVHSIQ